nr:uncharacterized protein LOC114924687 [Arachis hypogaea]
MGLICVVYGAHDKAEKLKLWPKLSDLRTTCRALMVIGGDFNDILKPEKRLGCKVLSQSGCEFKAWVENMELVVLELSGRKYTWYGDHCGLLVDSGKVDWGPKSFRSLDAWLSHGGFVSVVKDEEIEKGGNDECLLARAMTIRNVIEVWYKRREDYWKQLSRSRFASQMDKNTKFFHSVAKTRRRSKVMKEIHINGNCYRGVGRVKNEVQRFYKEEQKLNILFDKSLVKSISATEARGMELIPSKEEIRSAVWGCVPSRAVGPDGFNFKFIRRLWEVIGDDFCSLVRKSFVDRSLPKEANLTWVTLAHKEGGTNELKDYWPISMVGCLYKLKRSRKAGWLIKLDFQKAYDRFLWDFVDMVLEGMGFGCISRRWIWECLTTASMAILINGTTTKPFNLQRELRQGDPLSTFLFVLVGEVLNKMLERLCKKGVLRMLEVGKGKVELSHLQFANDTILFCPCDLETISNYRRVLLGFELLSSLRINYDKIVLIGLNMVDGETQRACEVLRCKEGFLPIKYLGVPLGANPKRIHTWDPVIRKVEERLKGWMDKDAGTVKPASCMRGLHGRRVRGCTNDAKCVTVLLGCLRCTGQRWPMLCAAAADIAGSAEPVRREETGRKKCI